MQPTSSQSESDVQATHGQFESHVQENMVPSNSQCHSEVQANVVESQSESQVHASSGSCVT